MERIGTSEFYNPDTWKIIEYPPWIDATYRYAEITWCENNGSNDRFYLGSLGYVFENSEDAVLFALRWS